MTPSTHRPVLLAEAIEALRIRPDGAYVDATFGRGGHSVAILARLSPQGRLIALDRDPEAVAVAQSIRDPRFAIRHARFSQLAAVLRESGLGAVDGVLFDLGVSAPQLETRGAGIQLPGRRPARHAHGPDAGRDRSRMARAGD